MLKINKIYIEVLLPIPFGSLFTYKVSDELISEVLPGKRVIVPFGRQKVYSALIKNILHEHANPDSLKEIQSVLDDAPLVNDFQFKLWEWMSEYYMCSQGEVMNSALPSALKLASETKVMLSADADLESEDLTSNEEILVSALSKIKK